MSPSTESRLALIFVPRLPQAFEHYAPLVRHCVGALLLGHYMACFWYLVSDETNEGSWRNVVLDGEIPVRDIYARYVISFYWCFATLTTVGYGDISPGLTHGNTAEQLFAIASMLIGE